jgi:hypothetical protein
LRPVEETPILPPPNQGPHTGYLTDLLRLILRLTQQIGFRLNRSLPKQQTAGDLEPMQGPLPLAEYTVATLPTASDFEGAIIYVSDGSAGQKFRASDGSSWLNMA